MVNFSVRYLYHEQALRIINTSVSYSKHQVFSSEGAAAHVLSIRDSIPHILHGFYA